MWKLSRIVRTWPCFTHVWKCFCYCFSSISISSLTLSSTYPFTHLFTQFLLESPIHCTHRRIQSHIDKLTHWPTNQVTVRPTFLLAHSPINPLIYLLSHPFTHLTTRALYHFVIYPLFHSHTHHLPIHLLIHLNNHQLTLSFTHPLTYSVT